MLRYLELRCSCHCSLDDDVITIITTIIIVTTIIIIIRFAFSSPSSSCTYSHSLSLHPWNNRFWRFSEWFQKIHLTGNQHSVTSWSCPPKYKNQKEPDFRRQLHHDNLHQKSHTTREIYVNLFTFGRHFRRHFTDDYRAHASHVNQCIINLCITSYTCYSYSHICDVEREIRKYKTSNARRQTQSSLWQRWYGWYRWW